MDDKASETPKLPAAGPYEILVLGQCTKIFLTPSSKAYGYCHDTGAIQLDPRQSDHDFAVNLCHEMLHRAAFHVFAEDFVDEFSQNVFNALGVLGYKVVRNEC
jgi:hypothetical protein